MQLILETERITKDFGRIVAIAQLDLQVEKGKLKSIIGPNGAGKTTLFNTISGKLHPTTGKVKFKGEDITHLSPDAIARRGLARSFQITNIFPNLTVFEKCAACLQQKTKRDPLFHFCIRSSRHQPQD